MKLFKRTTSVVALLAAMASSQQALAQSMDYGSLEMLFGEPVTTSATGKPQRATEAPVSMEIITAEQIKRSGASNIPDAIRFTAGVDVIQYTSTDNEVSVRGYNGSYAPRLLVLINGRQVYMDHYGMTNWSSLPVVMQEIRQIEIVKGPNTALFGFNAAAGVVNIVTFNPLLDDKTNFTVRGGTQDTIEVSGVATFNLGEKIGVRMSGEVAEQSSFDNPFLPGIDGALEDPFRHVASIDTLAQVADETQLGLELTYSDSERNESVGPTVFSTGYETYSAKAHGISSTKIGLVKGTVYSNWLDVDYGGGSILENQVTVVQLEDLFKVGTDHSFRISGEYRQNEMDVDFNVTDTEDSFSNIKYDVWSIGAMWDWAITEKVSLTNSVRFDSMDIEKSGYIPMPPADALMPTPLDTLTNADYDRTVEETSVNSGLVYKATDYDTFRVSYARGVRVPNLLGFSLFTNFGEVDSPFGPLSVDLIGNSEVDPTIVTNYEVGYDRLIEQIEGKLRVAVFYQENEDNLGTRTSVVLQGSPIPFPPFMIPTGATAYRQFDMVGDTNMMGVEVGVDGKVNENIDWDVNYTYIELDDSFDVDVAAEYDEDRTPHHRVNAHIGYTKDKWQADLFTQYVSDFADAGLAIDEYWRVDARVAYQVRDNVTLALTGTNLNGDHAEGASLEVEPKVLLQLSADF